MEILGRVDCDVDGVVAGSLPNTMELLWCVRASVLVGLIWGDNELSDK